MVRLILGLPPARHGGNWPPVDKALVTPLKGLETEEQAALLVAQRELRQLRETIQALRAELEQVQASRDEAVQAAVTVSQDEARQLRTTAASLRDELQGLEIAKQEAVQAAIAGG